LGNKFTLVHLRRLYSVEKLNPILTEMGPGSHDKNSRLLSRFLALRVRSELPHNSRHSGNDDAGEHLVLR